MPLPFCSTQKVIENNVNWFVWGFFFAYNICFSQISQVILQKNKEISHTQKAFIYVLK